MISRRISFSDRAWRSRQKNDDGYKTGEYHAFKNAEGDSLKVITLISYVLHGTYGYKGYWRVDNDGGCVWQITELDEKSPL